MIVRPARGDDVSAIVDMGMVLHADSSHGHVEYDKLRVASFVLRCIMSKDTFAWVAENDGFVCGFMAGAIQEWPFLDWMVATDLVSISVWAGAGRALLQQFEKWAQDNGANEVLIGVSYGGRDLAPLYERKGYRHVGGMFSKSLKG